MAVYRRGSRTRYVLAVLVLAALTLVTIDARSNGTGFTTDMRSAAHDVFSPPQRAAHATLRPIGNFLTGALDYGSLRSENQRLRNQVSALENQQIQSAADESAAQQILALHDLAFLGSTPTVTVEVINDESSNFETAVIVNKGKSSGIAVGQPVVAAGGLVGTVEAVSAHTATVVLLTDPTFAVGVRLDAANVGVAQGMGLTQPMGVTVDTTTQAPPELKLHQALVTSGLQFENFPANIPVGRVAGLSQPAGASEPTVTLRPLVDLDELTYLDVLLWAPT